MIEGSGSKSFRYAKETLYDRPETMHKLLAKISGAVTAYLRAQVEAGAQALQIFDTWGGILSRDAFEEFSLHYIQRIVGEVRASTSVPVIVFCKDCGHSLEKIAATGCDVVGLDWTTEIGDARAAVGTKVALQGNLDPTILYSSPARIREEVRSILRKFGTGPGHVFNLGHGIHPDIPVEHARAFIQAVKEESPAFH